MGRRSPRADRKAWSKRYPPMLMLGIGILLTATILPSALNIPLSNPSQTLEYAPVAEDSDTDSPDGNFASLGLGRGRGFGDAGTRQDEGSTGSGPGRGIRPSTKKCVGNPPRQTDDPLAPPCVAFFDGNNGGATYQGVTASEVRVLVYQDGYEDDDYAEYEEYECGRFTDLGVPPKPGDIWSFPYLRAYQDYFNDRYQTYNRFVHFWVQSSNCQYTVEARRADAETGFSRIRPFAVFPYVISENAEAYLEAIASREGVSFFIEPNRPAASLNRHPGFIYSYVPTVELQADLYSSYVCAKVVNYRVSFSGNTLDDNQPRRLGQLYADDPNTPEYRMLAERVANSIRRCGGEIALTRTVPWANTFVETLRGDRAGPSQAAAENMAAFKFENVTTILWTGLVDILHSRAAGAIDYRPEWVIAATGNMDANTVGALQESSVWEHAWVVSQAPYWSDITTQSCYLAAKEADPSAELEWAFTDCIYAYPAVRQLFTGIQVAGPRLTPRSLDQGFHAIPPIASTNPSTPACFYNPGDYSCVKDAIAEWWNPSGTTRGEAGDQPGCYTMTEPKKRYLVDTWPNENVDAQKRSTDRCNSFGSGGI